MNNGQVPRMQPTPRQMLQAYREQSPTEVAILVKQFNLLPVSDKMELLFHMHVAASSNHAMLQQMLNMLAARVVGDAEKGA